LDLALQSYERVLERTPGDLDLHNTVGDLLIRMGREAEAIGHFRLVADTYAENPSTLARAAAMYKKILRLEPRNLEVMLRVAEVHCRQNRKREARKFYNAAIELDELLVKSNETLEILKQICDLDDSDVALRLELAEKLDRAGRPFESHEAHLAAGRELSRQGRLVEALRIFQNALNVMPNSRPALSVLADLLVTLGRKAEAYEILAQALVKAPNDIEVLVIYGRVSQRAGDLDQAESLFMRLLKIDPSRWGYLLGAAADRLERGELDKVLEAVDTCAPLFDIRQCSERATKLLNGVLVVDRDNLGAMERLLRIYRATGDAARERTVLEQKLDRAMRFDQRDEAIEVLTALVEVAPDNAVYRAHLARLAPADGHGLEIVPGAESAAPPEPTVEEVAEPLGAGGEAGFEVAVPILEPVFPERAAAGQEASEETPLTSRPPKPVARLDPELARIAEERMLAIKQAYLKAGFREKAAQLCIDLARHYDRLDQQGPARDALYEALQLTPNMTTLARRLPASYRQSNLSARPRKLDEILIVRQFDEYLQGEWGRAARTEKPMALLRARICGVPADDELEEEDRLQGVARALAGAVCRSVDLFARSAHDEFIALLPETNSEGAATVARRLRARFRAAQKSSDDPMIKRLTIAIGVATTIPKRRSSPKSLLAMVEHAVEQAEESGDNRTVIAPA
jgi:diguanylate cyclase (GGDEF)-like protein